MTRLRRIALREGAAGAVGDRVRPARRLSPGEDLASAQASASAQAEPESAPSEQAVTPEAVDLGDQAGPPRIRRWPRRLGVAAGLVVLAVVGYMGWVGVSLLNAESKIYKPRPATPTRVVSHQAAPSATRVVGSEVHVQITSTPTPDAISGLPAGRINILVLGTDKRPNDPDHYPRSDTMILANVDTLNRKVRLMSMPRDLVADIPGYGVNKINSAYMFGEYYKEPGGGQALAASMVSQWFNVPIDYYVTANFDGFRKVIDTLGGVDIDVPYAIDDFHYPSDDEGDPFGEIHLHFDEGWQHMDGKTALRYARTRHADNDFMRNQRQLQVMVAARKAAMHLDLIPKLPSIIGQLGGSIETDIPFDKQLAFARFGYSLQPTDILTASITSEMIVPVTLDDGSEGLRLDPKTAGPVLEDFFGRSISLYGDGIAGDSSTGAEITPTTSAGSSSGRKVHATETPVSARTRTGTATRKTATPTGKRGTAENAQDSP